MSKAIDGQLSDEFKKDIRENNGKRNILGTLIAFIAIILVFGTLGIAGYELFFKPDASSTKTAEEKIESRPASDDSTTNTTTTTPAATTPTTTPDTTTTSTPEATTESEYTEYTVVSGDSYSSIANANGMSSAELMEYNDTSSEDLQIGQVIKIPKN